MLMTNQTIENIKTGAMFRVAGQIGDDDLALYELCKYEPGAALLPFKLVTKSA